MDFNKATKNELFTIIELLMTKLDALTGRVAELEEENRQLKVRKQAPIVRWAPSSDLIKTKSNQSQVVKSGLTKGGHKGHTLEIVSSPDFIDKRTPYFCNSCGSSLQNISEYLSKRRQVIDIPPIKSICTVSP